MNESTAVREVQVTIDCARPGDLAAFWAEALGYVLQPPPEPFSSWEEALTAWGVPESEHDSRSAVVDPSGAGPRIFFQRVPEGRQVKNRVHLDVRAAPGLSGDERMAVLSAESERLQALGATELYRVEPGGLDQGHITMADPEGNELCLD